MGTSERKQRERKQIERLILDEALKLFIEDGFENVSIRKLAENIEYSPATIYLYFKDKDDIFITLQKEAFAKFNEAQQEVQSIENPFDRLMSHGRAYIKFAFDNPELYDLMFIMKEPVKAVTSMEEWKTGKTSYDLLRKNVKECMEDSLLNINDVETGAFALWSFVHGIASLRIRRGMMIPDEYLDYLVNGAFEFIKNCFRKNK